MPELLQAPGEAFGPWDHATTALCLAALPALPSIPAIDIGCGSGLLCQAWARLHAQPVLAIDLDPHAISQTTRSIELAALTDRVTVRRAPIETIDPAVATGHVVLANIPLSGHQALVSRLAGSAPKAVVLSGFRAGQGATIVAQYRTMGLRAVALARLERWERWTLVSP